MVLASIAMRSDVAKELHQAEDAVVRTVPAAVNVCIVDREPEGDSMRGPPTLDRVKDVVPASVVLLLHVDHEHDLGVMMLA